MKLNNYPTLMVNLVGFKSVVLVLFAAAPVLLLPPFSYAEENQPATQTKDLPLSSEVTKRLADLKAAGKNELTEKLQQQIAKAWATASRYPQKHVIVGQVKLADAKKDVRLVDAQMVILEEGLFAGEVKDLERPVGFALQGYLPVELQLKGKSGEIVDVGEIILQPLTQKDSAGVSAKILLESGSPTNAKVKLYAGQGAVNTPHNGTSPRGSPGWEAPAELTPQETGVVSGSNLSPGNYYVVISAPGHVEQSRRIELTSGKTFDLGQISLLAELAGEKKPVNFWEMDYHTALAKAKNESKPLFVMLTIQGCGPCKRLEEEALAHSAIQSFLEPFLKVQIYADANEKNAEIAKKLQASGYPTLVCLDGNEKVLNRWSGYGGVTEFALECAKAYEEGKIPQPEELKKLVEKVKKNSS